MSAPTIVTAITISWKGSKWKKKGGEGTGGGEGGRRRPRMR